MRVCVLRLCCSVFLILTARLGNAQVTCPVDPFSPGTLTGVGYAEVYGPWRVFESGGQVYLQDSATGALTMVSVNDAGSAGIGSSSIPTLAGRRLVSSDGNLVLFNSTASNLIANDTNGRADAFVHNIQLSTTVRVSIASDGSESDQDAVATMITSDGRRVLFESTATTLGMENPRGHSIVYIHDLLTGNTSSVSDQSTDFVGVTSPPFGPIGNLDLLVESLGALLSPPTTGFVDVVVIAPDNQHAYIVATLGGIGFSLVSVQLDPISGNLSVVSHQALPLISGVDPFLVRSIVVSSDGTSVYIAGGGLGGTGTPYIIGYAIDNSSGMATLTQVINNGVFLAGNIFGNSGGMVISPDGKHVYVAAINVGLGDAFMFTREPSTGVLTFLGRSPDMSTTGSGLFDARTLAMSANGSNVYLTGQSVVGGGGDLGAVGTYVRDPVSGQLTIVQVLGNLLEMGRIVRDIAVSPDGAFVYGMNQGGFCVLQRNIGSGTLSFVSRLLQGQNDSLDIADIPPGRKLFAFSSNGAILYFLDASVLRMFHRDSQTGLLHDDFGQPGAFQTQSLPPLNENATFAMFGNAAHMLVGGVGLGPTNDDVVVYSWAAQDGANSRGSMFTPDDSAVLFLADGANVVAAGVRNSAVLRLDVQSSSLMPVSYSDNGALLHLGPNGLALGAMTQDGLIHVFDSDDPDLLDSAAVPQSRQVYVRDFQCADTQLISIGANGLPGDADSFGGFITPDGRFVVFESVAGNMPNGGGAGVYIRDRVSNVTRRLDFPTGSAIPIGGAPLGVSQDGRFVAFVQGTQEYVVDRDGEQLVSNVLADFAWHGPCAIAGLPVSFMALSANWRCGGAILSWGWDFGDCSQGIGNTVAHTFAEPGTYGVTTVGISNVPPDGDVPLQPGDLGIPVDQTHTVTVLSPEDATALITANFGAIVGTEGDSIPLSVQYSIPNIFGSQTINVLGTPVLFSGCTPTFTAPTTWDFGDGSAPEMGEAVSHVFPDNGPFTITVTRPTSFGIPVVATTTVGLANAPPGLMVNTELLILHTQEIGGPTPIPFNATVTDPGTGDTHEYFWDFGDGTSAFGGCIGGNCSVQHSYTEAGCYHVTLIVRDDDGDLDLDDRIHVVVNNPPVANAGGPVVLVLPGTPVTLDASGSFDPNGDYIEGYLWEQITGPQETPVILVDADKVLARFNAPDPDSGTFTTLQFLLTVTDSQGEQDLATIIVVSDIGAPAQPCLFEFLECPPVIVDAGPDVVISAGASTQIMTEHFGGYVFPDSNPSWQWSPSVGLNGTTIQNPIATPNVTTTYTVAMTHSLTGLIGVDQITIFVSAIGDADGDGIPDALDTCPLTPGLDPCTPLIDGDGDGICDLVDNCPGTINAAQIDSDSDRVGDACDVCPGGHDLFDTDGDGVPNDCDNCPTVSNALQTDTDGDQVGDVCDQCSGFDDMLDGDGDGAPNDCDNCPALANPGQVDTDGDGFGDACDICLGFDDAIDFDGDGVPDSCDNCPVDPNPGQADSDQDTVGNACDICCGDNAIDTDLDTIPDACDVCPGLDDLLDTDGDTTPDCLDGCPNDPLKIAPGVCGCGVSEQDSDGDGVPDCIDGCPADRCKVAPGVCGCGVPDLDPDGDGVLDCVDNCPADPNPLQEDADADGVGDACDVCPGFDDTLDCNANGIPDGCDIANCPPGDATCADCNANGIPDGCDITNCPPGDATCADCNANGIPDGCDIANCPPGDLTCADCNANGIPDGCDITNCPPGDATCADCNANGIPDGCDLANCPPGDATCADCNNNGIPDECEITGILITQIIDAVGDGAGNLLSGPPAIAVDAAGNAYVTGDASDNAFKITPAGVITEIINATGDGAGNGLDRPFGIAVDSMGDVYIAGLSSDNAFKITPAGVITEIIDATGDGAGNGLSFSLGIAVDSGGNAYVTGASSNNAFKITPAGVITQIIDFTGDGAGTFASPRGIAVDAAGNVYVTGGFDGPTFNAFKITPAGVITRIINFAGDGAGNLLNSPSGIAVDAAGNAYVTGFLSDNAFKITPAGVITRIINISGDGVGNLLSGPLAIAVDGAGNVYVTGALSNNAFKITSAGVITQIIDFTGDGTGNNLLATPRGIAVGAVGNVFVAGVDSHNAFKITLLDCNGNGIPDDCESDCNANGFPDECEIADCPPDDVTCADCNANGIPDGCDITDCPPGDATCADCNNNGIPDECDISQAVQQAKLSATNPVANNLFGSSVSISGDTAVIGVPGDGAGSAYVFVNVGGIWAQQAQLLASDGVAGDQFGLSVAISGDTIVVAAGAAIKDAYVFVRNGTTWPEQARLQGLDASNPIESVAISGDTIVVGQPNTLGLCLDVTFGIPTTRFVADMGSVRVYARVGTIWGSEFSTISPDFNTICAGPFDGERFGHSVAISGDTMVVGAPLDSPSDFRLEGGAYVFVRDGTTWSQQAMLRASDSFLQDLFGTAVGISGDVMIVGSPNHTVTGLHGFPSAGSAYVFARNGTTWSEEAELLASDLLTSLDARFGTSVAISGNRAAVGAPRGALDFVRTGSAYAFVRTGTSWSEEAELLASDGLGFDNFGDSVAISGDTIIAGAPQDDDVGADNSGSAYVFAPLSQDSNADGVPDECVSPLGDMNGDGGVGPADVSMFVQALIDPANCTGCLLENADMNGDLFLNGDDIQLFVDAVLAP